MIPMTFVLDAANQIEEKLGNISRKIWEYAELPYEEVKSAALLTGVLKEEGFIVEEGVAGIPTAFVATFTNGTGGMVAGFLGEYDALDALSQKPDVIKADPIKAGAAGHGCGHNLLGAGALGAALVLKEYFIKNNVNGKVVYYGCPGEEGAGSKQFMGRAGVFDEADFILTWHPSTINGIDYNPCNAILGANFYFKGISAHAGGSPHLGRSALDAAELMSVGVNYLREHMIDKARIHYAYSDVGGTAPNVVQDRATVKYEVRSPKVSQTRELFERVVKVAKGAAMMTETDVTYELTMGFSDYKPNMALAKVAQEVFEQMGAPEWDEAEYTLAKAYLDSYDEGILSNIKESLAEKYGKERAEQLYQKPLSSEVEKYDPLDIEVSGGSTDVGDVSYIAPTLQILAATNCMGNVGHTWQTVGQSCSDIGTKGMMTAVKVMALSAINLLMDSDQIRKAKEEVILRSGGKYVCPLPDEVLPPIGKY